MESSFVSRGVLGCNSSSVKSGKNNENHMGNGMTDLDQNLKLAEKMAARCKVSRRDFIQLALAAGMTVAAADKLFVTAARAEPKKGGTLRLGLGHGATTDSLDPGTYPDQFTGTLGWGSLGNALTEVDAKGNITPDLAESFEPLVGAKA